MSDTLFSMIDGLATTETGTGRTRSEERYRNTNSKDGTLSVIISPEVASRIVEHCKRMDISKTKFVNAEMKKAMDRVENEWLLSLTKEELVEMIISGKDVSDVHD